MQIVEYLSEVMINMVRFYPKSLMKLLIMYNFCKNNTDLGYDIDFLNIYFGDINTSKNITHTNLIETFS
jgi:hypothetical protein